MTTGADIIHQHDLYFDGGDKANGSLYLCFAPGTAVVQVEAAIERLRSAGLWSQTPYKQVPQTQKAMYAEQMQFVDSFKSDGVVAARYDHPKYPSDAQRWSEWQNILSH